MSKHTSGPWKWINENGWYVLKAANGTYVADDGSACDEYGRAIDPEDEGESGANARLIAAAPDLLHALIRLARQAGENRPISGALQQAEQAIAKATGAAE